MEKYETFKARMSGISAGEGDEQEDAFTHLYDAVFGGALGPEAPCSPPPKSPVPVKSTLRLKLTYEHMERLLILSKSLRFETPNTTILVELA